MSKAGSKGMAGMVMAIPIFTAPHSNTSKGLAISIHAHSDLVEPHSLVSTGEHGLL